MLKALPQELRGWFVCLFLNKSQETLCSMQPRCGLKDTTATTVLEALE
jgi:hypothetical protein